MNRISYDKSINLLEEAIVHFLTIGQYGIVAELCENLLECDDIFHKSNNIRCAQTPQSPTTSAKSQPLIQN